MQRFLEAAYAELAAPRVPSLTRADFPQARSGRHRRPMPDLHKDHARGRGAFTGPGRQGVAEALRLHLLRLPEYASFASWMQLFTVPA